MPLFWVSISFYHKFISNFFKNCKSILDIIWGYWAVSDQFSMHHIFKILLGWVPKHCLHFLFLDGPLYLFLHVVLIVLSHCGDQGEFRVVFIVQIRMCKPFLWGRNFTVICGVCTLNTPLSSKLSQVTI